ncbi:MAG TPA: DUF6285 domain-containing protein [Dehalococcoidia bacterium]|nr:DUF6285 domain-containing protein [Dehalococcoidia bacterium]
MQDRPTYDELLAAIEHFLDAEVVPNLEGARGFHTRVAASALRTVRRELTGEDEHLTAEWEGLDALLGPASPPKSRAGLRDALSARNAELCERIRAGEADDGPFADDVRAHIRSTIRHKLSVTDPGLLERTASTE